MELVRKTKKISIGLFNMLGSVIRDGTTKYWPVNSYYYNYRKLHKALPQLYPRDYGGWLRIFFTGGELVAEVYALDESGEWHRVK